MSFYLIDEYTKLSDFDYLLPEGMIAKYPLDERDQSKMLILDRERKTILHEHFFNLPQFFEEGDLLVLNNSRVIPARLYGRREGHKGSVEIFLMRPEDELKTIWHVLMKPARKLREGTVVLFDNSPLKATVLTKSESGGGTVKLEWPQHMELETILDTTGVIPIPPYLERKTEAIDSDRYQTVFARIPGAQAAPTAGLHFTLSTLNHLKARGLKIAEITLHVSAGTFRPVLSEKIEDHKMDPEFYTIPEETADAIKLTKAQGKKVIAVGTTVMKTLETSTWLNNGEVKAESAWSELFIRPGFSFQVIDTLLTNFHLPRSTLLMLVSAFASRDLILKAYSAAIEEQYRFYSYGDCMLIV